MRKTKTNLKELDLDLTANMEMPKYKEPKTWTIITALNHVLDEAKDSRLSDTFWKRCKNALAFLRKELGLTDIQIVALAIMIETGDSVTWKRLGDYLNLTRLSMMVYSEEIEELVTKRWAMRKASPWYTE